MITDYANVILAITSVMPCDRCPYPCVAKTHSSQANCDRHWYEILASLPPTSKDVWFNEISMRLMERD